jgi:hypothetical protein
MQDNKASFCISLFRAIPRVSVANKNRKRKGNFEEFLEKNGDFHLDKQSAFDGLCNIP